MKTLTAIENGLVKAETFFLVLFLSVMILLAFAQVILRNVFGTGILWADTVVRHLVLWVGFAGAAIAAGSERHIAIDALTKFLPARTRHFARVLTNIFALLVCLLLADAAYTLLLDELHYGGTMVLEIPSWVGVAILAPGYLLMAFHFFVKSIQSFMLATGRAEEPGTA
ncbi:MAG: TRAP transporter small permease subunit [Ignavibacteria bacterium]|nr:TRAP transporter small permease subunit [Ignavibacteria bacterium]